MDLTSEKLIKNLLQKYNIRPSKRLGQNFLVDRSALNKIVESADLKPDDMVLEIGPGLGVLTQALAKRVKKVVAVEKDAKLVEILKDTLKDFNNVKVVHSDILDIRFPDIIFGKSDIPKYKIVANLPYYITSPVIRQFLERTEARPLYGVLMVQKEVGQRICAKPPRMNLLAVSVQFYAEPEIISYISKSSFWPQPKVDSAILKITPKAQVAGSFPVTLFFRIVRAGFSQPRKQLVNNLSKGLKYDKKKAEEWLLGNNIKPAQRAETLTVQDWLNFTKSFRNML